MTIRNTVFMLIVSAALLPACGPAAAPDREPGESRPGDSAPARAVYYWKTVYALTDFDIRFLNEHRISKIYLRFFDVALERNWNTDKIEAVPIATARLGNRHREYLMRLDTAGTVGRTRSLEIVPTVFITLEALRNSAGDENDLAVKIIERIFAMADFHGFPPPGEIQFDCDWTPSTQAAYFKLCESARGILKSRNCLFSTTVRLHQLKTACPPADKGVLMLYNTGAFKKPGPDNSILRLKDAVPYLNKVNYALPLDLAFPAFSWAVWFRKGVFQAILHNPDTHAPYLEPGPGPQYRVREAYAAEKHTLLPGDTLRIEQSGIAEILNVKTVVRKALRLQHSGIILYHLDSLNLSKFTSDEIEQIFAR